MRHASCVVVLLALATLLIPAAATAHDIVQVTDDAYLNYMPSMIERDDGTLMLAYERLGSSFANGDILVTTSVDGASWAIPTVVVDGPGNERHPALVQLDDGTFQIYYLTDESGGYRIHMADSPGGTAWTARGEIDLGWTTEDLVNPTVVVEDDGSLTMTYDVLSDGGYIAHSADGATWDQAKTRVSSGSLNRIMRHSDGTYVLSYQRKTGIWYYQIDVFTKTSTDRVTWSGENRVTTNQNSHDSFPVELADGQYALYYAVSNGGNPYELVSRVSPDGAGWGSEDAWLPYAGWDTQPHPVVLASGVVALAWARGPEQDDTEVHFALLDPPTGVAGNAAPPHRSLRAAPNPFTGSTSFTVPHGATAPTSVTIHDVAGRLVRRLTGRDGLTWDGRDTSGRLLPSGVYFARATGTATARTRVLLLR
ncbi:MAG: T9SS type A sorting domain-containing protein [Candidatus Eisenbacteria bacterium]|nr:T9SS type A sorting domain-containing protein [Candidatus Eisenbacteria bacterium]